jgi:hypothetical protein
MLFHPFSRVFQNKKNNRRAAVIVWTVVSTTVILGFSALAVDMGYTYHVQTELQRTADAAAMAAASQMADVNNLSDQGILDIAREYAQKNKTGGIEPTIDESDIVLGRSVQDGDGKTTFIEGQQPYDAVKVTVRLTHGSPNGPVPLFFGKALGKPDVDLSASAIAMLVPRDLAIVIDLSRSMNYDSQLRHETTTTINIKKVWQDLGSHTYGNMTTFHNTAGEMPTYNGSSTTLANLGLTNVPYPYPNCGSWADYLNYVKENTSSPSPTLVTEYKNRYGLRTFINYLLATRTTSCSALANTQAQPTYALKQAVEELDTYLLLQDSGDHISLHSYADNTSKIQTLTPNYLTITTKVYQQWAGGSIGTNTNISAGIENAITELTSTNARKNAKKVIFLMTDGQANLPSNTTTGTQYALSSANHALAHNIQIYTIGLGTDADQDLMAEIASIGKGVFYYVPTFNIAQYSEDLKRVFRTLGGKRPVRLIQ